MIVFNTAFLLSAILVCDALKWMDEPMENAIMQACSSVFMAPWHLTIDPEDQIHNITWLRGDNEVVATHALGNFRPFPPFCSRVRFLCNAGILLRNLTKMDWGIFRVNVAVEAGNGTSFHVQRSVILSPCPEGYEYMPACGFCLKFDPTWVTHDSAVKLCRNSGGVLAMPKTHRDLQCVFNFKQSTGVHRTWLGAKKVQSAPVRRSEWLDGTPLPNNSTLWPSTGPSYSTHFSGDCVYVCTNSARLCIMNCNWSRSYVCQAAPLC